MTLELPSDHLQVTGSGEQTTTIKFHNQRKEVPCNIAIKAVEHLSTFSKMYFKGKITKSLILNHDSIKVHRQCHLQNINAIQYKKVILVY